MEPVLGCQTHLSTVVLKFTVSITYFDGVYGDMHSAAAKGEPGGGEWGCKHQQGRQGQAHGPLCQQPKQALEGDRHSREPLAQWLVPPALSPVGSLQGEATNQMS